jgi:hypothetical protein
LHVLHSPYRFRGDIVEPGLAMGLNPEISSIAEQALKDRYGPALKQFTGVSFHVLNGVAGVEILRFVRRHGVQQVYMAQGVAQRKLSGTSTTLHDLLLERCPCAILLVYPGRGLPDREVVASGESGVRNKTPKVVYLDRYRRRGGHGKKPNDVRK